MTRGSAGVWLSMAGACLVGFACGPAMTDAPPLMTAEAALNMVQPAPDHFIAYGDDPLHFGQLRLPKGEGPHPVAIVIHGGCWLAEYDLGYVSGLAAALTEAGIATWSVEYRRIGDIGGGWPGTLADVADAADHLRTIATSYNLDLERVVATGHSAGGHLALWLAARHSLLLDDELRGERPLVIHAVVALAGIPDLATYSAATGCGAAVPELLDGQPDDVPDRLRRASPIELLPLGVPQILVAGRLDPIVPPEIAETYRQRATAGGDLVSVREIADAGHFELVNPHHPAFSAVRSAVLEVIESLPRSSESD